MEAERRRLPRLRTLLAGVLSFNDRCSTMDCVIRNASEDGAFLKLSGSVQLPESFELDIPARQKKVMAHVIWRHPDGVGVAFGDLDAVASTELLARLKATQAANVRLQERVRQLTEAG